ncbi:hypothetical protein HYDPIDRAFT_118701 [Hydnomerulius pinastri MD-312]|uniref:DUF6533 domain-containing protein n=1 Tax=Hydnomerulius pinastri MD-312 TaxID=994086 RepID=A0A0C9W0B6_9AGAM|nr:hypothetical protein HYDPIDRAFT_118701 [Hydnomerulius pinastri MD-312]
MFSSHDLSATHRITRTTERLHSTAAALSTEVSFANWLRQQDIIKYCRVAPISIWAFDYLLTFDQEVRLMSGEGGWGITHLLYIPTRYFPMIGSICSIYNALVTTRPADTCIALYRTAELILFFGMVAAEGLLLIRTMALWHYNKLACRILVSVYSLAAIVMFICIVISTTLKFEGICSETTSSIATATATRLSQVTVGMFSSAAFFELVVVAFTLVHGFRIRGSHHPAGKLVAAVAQGNLVYSLTIFVTSVANITFFVLPLEDGWNGLLATFQGVLHGVVASRILFNLRDAIDDRGDIHFFSMTRMQFASAPMSGVQDDEY